MTESCKAYENKIRKLEKQLEISDAKYLGAIRTVGRNLKIYSGTSIFLFFLSLFGLYKANENRLLVEKLCTKISEPQPPQDERPDPP